MFEGSIIQGKFEYNHVPFGPATYRSPILNMTCHFVIVASIQKL